MLRDIIGQRQDTPEPGKPVRSKSAVAAFQSVDTPPESHAAPAVIPTITPSLVAPHTAQNHRNDLNGFSRDVAIKGALQCTGDLVIDGHLEGEVQVDGQLSIGENGQVMGEVRALTVIVFGRVKGNISAEDRCEVRSSAAIEGDICAGSLSIEDGAAFNGRSTVGAARQPTEQIADPS